MFGGCTGLTGVTLHEGLTTIASSAFTGCSKLAAMEIPNSVTSIGGNAFYSCTKLTSVTFKDDSQLTTIGNGAFENSGITSFEIPKRVSSIQQGTFSSVSGTSTKSKLATLTVHSENQNFKAVNNVLYDFNVTRSILSALAAKTITIPGTVTTIGNNSFRFSSVSSLTFEESDTPLQIGDTLTADVNCFAYCKQLTTLNLPLRLTAIGRYAFNNATKLSTVGFAGAPAAAAEETGAETEGKESQLTTIGNYAFTNCSALASIKIPKNVTTIGTYVFNKCAKLAKVEFDKDSKLTEVPQQMFNGTTGNFTVSFPDSITSIGYRAFYGCTGITAISFADTNITTIGEQAFRGCTKLAALDFGGTSVTAIQDQAFYGCTKLATVDFTDSEVTTIGKQAFRNTSTNVLKTLKFTATAAGETDSKVQTIGERAFARSIVESVTLPASLQLLDDGAFAYCVNLNTVVFRDHVADASGKVVPFRLGSQTAGFNYTSSSLSDGASYAGKTSHVFVGCTLLESVTLPNGLTELKAGTFYKCSSLTGITLPSGMTGLGAEAFFGCAKLAAITIPETVEEIAAGTFSGCTALATVTATGTNIKVENGMLVCNNMVLLFVPGAKNEDGTAVTSVAIPEGITAIGTEAFKANTNLIAITIPASVETIGEYAFSGLPNLERVTFAAGDVPLSVGAYAFSSNAKLTTVAFPARLASLGRYAFYNSTALTAIDLENTQLTEISERAFSSTADSTSLKTVKLPASVTKIADEAFYGNTDLQTVTFATGSRLETVGECAFYGSFKYCEGYGSIAFPSSLRTIGQGCFQHCYKLQSVDFGKNSRLTEIPELTFQNCFALEHIVIPANVTAIGTSAFNKKTYWNDPEEVLKARMQLQSVVFEDGSKLETLGQSAFGYVVGSFGDVSNEPCVNLTSVDFGKNGSLKTIMRDAFHGCEKLETVQLPYSLQQIEARAFKGCALLTEVSFGEEITEIGEQVFYGCKELTVLDLPESVAFIGAGAFSGCVKLDVGLSDANTSYTVVDGIMYDFDLTTIVLVSKTLAGEYTVPDTITAIADGAFSGNRGLTKITVPTSIREIGNNVFADCTALEEIVLHNRLQSIGDYAFSNTALSEITIAKSVTSVGTSAFEGCASLTDVSFEFGVDRLTLGNAAFKNCTALESIEIPQRVRGKYDSSKYIMYYGIGGSCFEGCTKLKNVTFEADLGMLNNYSMTFGDAAFKDCTSLESITLPNYLRSINCSDGGEEWIEPAIGADCFVGCDKLADVIIPDSVSPAGSILAKAYIIGDRAFKGLKLLKSINLTAVTGLSNSVFEETGLESVEIPETLQSSYNWYTGIGEATFKNCKNLASVAINSKNLPSLAVELFAGCSALEEITVPASTTTISTSVFKDCTNLKKVTFATATNGTTKLRYVHANAFENCTSLTELTLPATVTTLGANVFSGWTATQTVNTGIAESAVPSTWDENWRTGCDANVVWASSATE